LSRHFHDGKVSESRSLSFDFFFEIFFFFFVVYCLSDKQRFLIPSKHNHQTTGKHYTNFSTLDRFTILHNKFNSKIFTVWKRENVVIKPITRTIKVVIALRHVTKL
jgi:hypothetical protein